MSTETPQPPAPQPGAEPTAAPRGGAAPAHERGGFGRGFGIGFGASLGFGTVLLVTGLVASLVLALGLVALGSAVGGGTSGAGTAGGQETEPAWGSPSAGQRLVAVPIEGPILGSSADGATVSAATYGYDTADLIDSLAEDTSVDGLVLEITTPGGSVNGSRAIADAVTRYQESTGKRVVAFVRGLSASGGMYAMAGADEIIADHGSLVGSIGVIFGPIQRYNDVTGIDGSLLQQGVETQGGITQEYFSRGEGKDLGNPYRDVTEAERASLDRILDNFYGDFVTTVATGRDIPEQRIRDEIGAFVYDSETAREIGLVDDVLGADDAYRRAAEVNELDPDDTRVDRVVGPDVFEQLIGASSDRLTGTSSAEAEPVPGVNILCSGEPTVLVYYGDPTTECTATP